MNLITRGDPGRLARGEAVSDSTVNSGYRLVTIVAAYELEPHVAADLRALGVPGWTSTRVNGQGVGGTRRYGLLDGANVKFETVVERSLADRLAEHLVKQFAGHALVAFASDVDVVLMH